jgi:hypothetical protein
MRTFGAYLVLIVLTGCSQDTGQDLANCKIKAMELLRPSADDLISSTSPTLRYIDACMAANGYSARADCASMAYRSDSPGCWFW